MSPVLTALLIMLVVLLPVALAFMFGGSLVDRQREWERERELSRHRTEVFLGRAEPVGTYEELLSGQGREIRDPAASQIAERVLHAPTGVSRELIEEWVAEFAHREPGEVDASGRFRFQRIRDGEEIDGQAKSEAFDYSVLTPVAGTMPTGTPAAESPSRMGTMEETPHDAFVLIKRTPLSLSFSTGMGAAEFDPTDVESVRRWVENRINEPGSRGGLWLDVFEPRGRGTDQASVEDALLVPYDLGSHRAVWPPVGDVADA